VKTGDFALVKQLNRAIVLNLIRTSSPISRSEISRACGLNKATVSSLAAELVTEGQVLEIGAGHSSGGRRPQLLSFHAQAGLALGLEVGVHYVRGLSCDLVGRPLAVEHVDLAPDAGPEETIGTVVKVAKSFCASAPVTPLGILGMGVGVPGTVDAQGAVLMAPNLGWTGIALRSNLEAALGMPVWVENTANAAAMGERYMGVGTRTKNLVYINLGVGVGAGIILGDRLYRGTHGVAGEVGHMSIEAAGPVCGCGNRGCWEMFASEKGLRRWLPGREQVGLPQLLAEADAGNSLVIAALRAVGESLGIGLVSVINAFDPELVAIGGPLAQAGHYLINPALRVLAARMMPGPGQTVPVIASTLGLNACALGAAAILLNQHFSLPSLNS